jgi:DNA-binding NtrC family response regulator
MNQQVPQRPEGAPQHILLLDDEPPVLQALKLLMQAVGYSVTGFSSAAEALEYIRTDSEAELLVCDLRMPKLNGLAVLKQVRQIRPELPVVLMSAQLTREEESHGRLMGAIGFLNKPFLTEDLHQLTRRVGQRLKS